jgi:hypothetical protein
MSQSSYSSVLHLVAGLATLYIIFGDILDIWMVQSQ